MNEEYTNQKEANKHGIILILLLLIVFLTASLAITYAIVNNLSNNSSKVKLANWKIIVNDKDITKSKSFPINDFNWKSKNTKTNMIAPGSVGTTTLKIKNLSDVSSKVNIKTSIMNNNKNININSLKLSLSDNNFILNKNNSKDIKVIIKWLDIEDNDSNDTYIGKNINNINIYFDIDVDQIKE